MSEKIARGEFEALKDLVYPETIEKVKKAYEKITDAEKDSLRITTSNLFKVLVSGNEIRKGNGETWVKVNTRASILNSPKGLPKSIQEYFEFIHGPEAEKNILNASMADYTYI